MILYRIAKAAYARDLSGKGTALFGGRWNPMGVPVLYTTTSIALAVFENLVHIGKTEFIPVDYYLATLSLPDREGLIKEVSLLPSETESKIIGQRFVQQGVHLALKVPSVVVPLESNFILNPAHSTFEEVKLLSCEPFQFDPRLLPS